MVAIFNIRMNIKEKVLFHSPEKIYSAQNYHFRTFLSCIIKNCNNYPQLKQVSSK